MIMILNFTFKERRKSMADMKTAIPKIAAQIKKAPYDASWYNTYYSAVTNLCKQTDKGKSQKGNTTFHTYQLVFFFLG